MPDITDQLSLATSTPQEAAEHIDSAKIFNVTPDVYKGFKSELQPEVAKMKLPSQATPAVSRYVASGPEQASLVKNDIPKLSKIEAILKYTGDQVLGRPSIDRELSDLNIKKMFEPDKFSEQDDLRAFELTEKQKKFSDYGLSAGERLVGDVAGGITSIFSSLGKHSGLILGATAAGAGTGAVAGLPFKGVGAIPGAVAVGGQALVASSLAALTVDGTKMQIGLIHNELDNLTDDNGQPIKALDAETKRNISLAVGVATGAITSVVGRGVAKTIPFINKLVSPKFLAQVVVDPAKAALRQTLFNVGKSVSLGGAGGGIQKSIEVMAKEFAKSYDGTEASYLNALSNASGEIAQAVAVGGLTTGTLTGVGQAIGYKGTKKQFIAAEEAKFNAAKDVGPQATTPTDILPTRPKGGGGGQAVDPTSKAVEILHFDEVIDHVSTISKETEISKLAPGEQKTILKSTLDEAGIKKLFLLREDLTVWADTEDKAKLVRDIIDPTGETAASMNAPIKVAPHEFLPLVLKHPDISELVKLDPEGPNVKQAKEYLANIQKADETRKQILEKLNVKDISPEERANLEAQLQPKKEEGTYPSNDVFGEDQFMDQTKLKTAMKGLVTEKQAETFLESDRVARQNIVDNINEAAKYEMDKVIDIVVENAKEVEFEAQLARLENNPNLNLVDKFKSVPDFTPQDLGLTHAKEGYSPFAIDPSSLSESQAKQFLKNEQLKSHRVFVKGGMSLDDSARMLGVSSGEDLLKILAQTPTREEVASQRVAAREADILQNAIDSTDVNETHLIKAYENRLKNAVDLLNYMKAKEWPTLRGEIIKIATKPPTIEEIKIQAREFVAKTKIGDLSVNQFKVGERKSHKEAMVAITKGQPEKAFESQRLTALNIAIAKEMQTKIAKVNRVIKFSRKFRKPDIKQELKDAGPTFENAVNEVLDVFHLAPDKKGTAEKGSFQKYISEQVESGGIVPTIPERLFTDLTQSMDEMTVEQVLAVGDLLKSTLHAAKYKNKLFTKFENIKAVQTMDGFANLIDSKAKANFDYKPERNDVVQKSTLENNAFVRALESTKSITERAQHLLVKMDDDKPIGTFNDMFYRPLVEMANAEKKLSSELRNQFEKIIKNFGEEEYKNLATEKVEIPEFKNNPGLGYGKLSKLELFAMELNYGNESNIKALERFGVSRDVIRTVLDRELTDKHTNMAQDFRNVHLSFRPKIKDLELRTTGVEPEWVEAQPYVARGKVVPGGYYPLMYISDQVKTQAKKVVGTSELTSAERIRQRLAAQAETEQGHLEKRVGSEDILDLDMNRYFYHINQVIHDLTHREGVRDLAKLYSDKRIRESFVSVLGKDEYLALTDNLIKIADSSDQGYNRVDGIILDIYTRLGNGATIMAIGAKLSSIAVQGTSLLFAVDKMGTVSGTKHIAKTVARFASNPELLPEFYKFAAEIHPDIAFTQENLESSTVQNLLELVPTNKKGIGAKLSPIIGSNNFIKNMAVSALGVADVVNKVVVVTAAYSQAISGEVEGIKAGDIQAAKKYAGNIAELTQTHSNLRNRSAIQDEKYVKPILMFWNDANNVLNSNISAVRQSFKSFKQAKGKFSEGDFSGGAKKSFEGTFKMFKYLIVTSTLGALYQNWSRNKQTFSEDDEKPLDYVSSLAGATISNTLSNVPVVRDIQFSVENQSYKKTKTIESPIAKVEGNFATAFSGLKHFLSFSENVTEQEARSWLYLVGYLGQLPLDGLYRAAGRPNLTELPTLIKSEAQKATDAINKFIKKNPDVPKEYIDQLNKIKNQIEPDTSVTIPDKTLDIIKHIESKGEPLAFNPQSSAAGIYQFTEATWESLMKKAPELGLTENGRVSSNTAQQEKAMEYLTLENIKFLKSNNIDVNVENIYMAHFLGINKAVEVLKASGDIKVKSLVGENVLKNNDLKNSMKVKDFKDWILERTLRAEIELDKRQQLTKPLNE